MKILAIETSCDETSCSIVSADNFGVQVLANIVSSQIKLHAKWGGVVPNLAAREHLKNFIPVLDECFKATALSYQNIDLIAITNGPGLIPALLIGTNAAKTLAFVWEKPLIGVHHIEGHIYANFIREVKSQKPARNASHNEAGGSKVKRIEFPILCLVVSGGHSQLVLMKKHLDYEIIGETLDDAAGEAFDKVARILGLGYPGGPAIGKIAKRQATCDMRQKNNSMSHGTCHMSHGINLPRPMLNSKNFNFSFSGLKTAVLYETKKHPKLLKNKKYIASICQDFQQAVVDVLIHKTIQAAKKYNPKTIMLAGGVSANYELRKQLGENIKKELPDIKYHMPDIKYSIDNASMIAAAAYYRWKYMTSIQKKKAYSKWEDLEPDANLELKAII